MSLHFRTPSSSHTLVKSIASTTIQTLSGFSTAKLQQHSDHQVHTQNKNEDLFGAYITKNIHAAPPILAEKTNLSTTLTTSPAIKNILTNAANEASSSTTIATSSLFLTSTISTAIPAATATKSQQQ